MTNGEKFCIDFPNIRIEVFVSYVQVVGENYEFNNLYPLKWWNAEYKEPTTKNDVPDNNVGKIGSTTKNSLVVDAVSRQALTDWLKNWTLGDATPLIDFVNSMPPVTPIRPKGHWINKHRFVESWSCSAECSSCHKRSNGYIHDNGYGLESTYDDFCPKCGSDNREVEE